MISRKPLTKRQRLTLGLIDDIENNLPVFGWGLFLCSSVFIVYGIHTVINNHILNNCNRSIYQIVEAPTAMGPAYRCVSRVQRQGPPVPLKD